MLITRQNFFPARDETKKKKKLNLVLGEKISEFLDHYRGRPSPKKGTNAAVS